MSLAVIGFSGRPVAAGAGVKAPVIKNSEDGKFAVIHQDCATTWWNASEIAAYEEQALLTRLLRPVLYQPGQVVLYAHDSFIAPHLKDPQPYEVEQSIRLPVRDFTFEPLVACYVSLLHLRSAYELQNKWADLLIAAADAALWNVEKLRKKRGVRALLDCMRAQFTTAGRTDAKAIELRWKVAVRGWAAQILSRGSDTEYRDDVALDFDGEQVLAIRREAISLLKQLPDTIAARGHSIRRDSPFPPYHCQEDSP